MHLFHFAHYRSYANCIQHPGGQRKENPIAYNDMMFKPHAPTYSMVKVYQYRHTKWNHFTLLISLQTV